MGIDFLDIMYRLKKELGIRFEREDFHFTPGGKYLVGEFYNLVEQKVCKASREILDSPDYWEKMFSEVRQAFAEGLSLSESERWTKETTVRQLYEQIPETERRKTWRKFRKYHVGYGIAQKINWAIDSKYPDTPFLIGCLGSLFLFILSPVLLIGYYFYAKTWLFKNNVEWGLGFVFILSVILFWLLNWGYIDKRRRVNFLPNMTLGEVIDQIVLREKKSLKNDGVPYTREEIEAIVKAALCAALAVKPEEVTPEKDLVRDLGMG